MSRPKLIPKRGPGRLQWSAEGWFGALLGGTLWMLLAAGADFARRHEMPWRLLASFAAAVTLGIFLWGRRDRLAPYRAIQLLVTGLGLCAAVALHYLRSSWGPDGQSFWWLALFPGMLVWFHLIERRSSAS